MQRVPNLNSLGLKKRLFMNHVQVGLSYQAKAQQRMLHSRNLGRHPIDVMLSSTEANELPAITLDDFLKGELQFDDESVFVSLFTNDGPTLRIFSLSKCKSRARDLELNTAGRDWVDLLSDWSKSLAKAMRDFADFPDELDIEIPDYLTDLCRNVALAALDVQPRVRRIMIHADPMWNVVPWQYIMCRALNNELAESTEQLIRNGKRSEGSRRVVPLAIWRVPGVQFGDAHENHTAADSSVFVDENDPTFEAKRQEIIEIRSRGSRGLLSILAHGSTGGKAVNFQIGNTPVRKYAMSVYGQYRAVLLHICHGSVVHKLHIADDILGAPGEIILGGAAVVLAAGSPIPLDFTTIIEKYFATLDADVADSVLLRAVEDRYLSACAENNNVGLYTMFSGRVSPRLTVLN